MARTAVDQMPRHTMRQPVSYHQPLSSCLPQARFSEYSLTGNVPLILRTRFVIPEFFRLRLNWPDPELGIAVARREAEVFRLRTVYCARSVVGILTNEKHKKYNSVRSASDFVE